MAAVGSADALEVPPEIDVTEAFLVGPDKVEGDRDHDATVGVARCRQPATAVGEGGQCAAARRRSIALKVSVVRGNNSPVPQSTMTPN